MWKGFVDEPWWDESFIQPLNAQMMGVPESLLLDLLHGICKEYEHNERGDEYGERGDVLVSCPCPMAHHSVAPKGFWILESVEGAMGTILQMVSRVSIEYMTDDCLGALGSRMKRQHEMVIDANFYILFCKNAEDAQHAQALQYRGERYF